MHTHTLEHASYKEFIAKSIFDIILCTFMPPLKRGFISFLNISIYLTSLHDVHTKICILFRSEFLMLTVSFSTDRHGLNPFFNPFTCVCTWQRDYTNPKVELM